jgi:hypothetical protein
VEVYLLLRDMQKDNCFGYVNDEEKCFFAGKKWFESRTRDIKYNSNTLKL